MDIDMKEVRKGYYNQNENGKLSWEGEYMNGAFNGYYKSYLTDGHLYWEGFYLGGVQEGEEIFYPGESHIPGVEYGNLGE